MASVSESPAKSPSVQAAPNRWSRLIPARQWLAAYQLAWLRADLFAGLTLAAYAVPVSLAYASLAGLPAQMGLCCYLFGGLAYALLGSSRELAIGPTSAISLLLGVSLPRLAGTTDPAHYVAMASLTTLLVALLFFLAWALKLNVIVNFFSDSLLSGFKAGAALAIASTQLPALLGIAGVDGNFFARITHIATHLSNTQLPVLGFSVVALALLFLGEKYLPGRPTAFGVVVVSLLAASFPGMANLGLPEARPLQPGLPSIAWINPSTLDLQAWRELIHLAFACFLLAFIESISAARVYAAKHQETLDTRQEMLALGQVNLLSALGHGFPAAGGLSQTAVNEKAGARTPMSLVVASTGIALILAFFTGLFRHLPQAVLAAVVVMAVKSLVDVGQLRHMWRASRFDFHAALVAFAGVLVFGILDGVIMATIVSLLMLLARTARPHVAILGRIPGTVRFSDRARHRDNETLPGILAFRVESSLYYFNVEHVYQTVISEVETADPTLQAVVCDLSTSPNIDLAGAGLLNRLHETLAARGIRFTVAEAHAEARDLLRIEGFEAKEGHISRKESLDAAIRRIQALLG